MLTEAHLNQPYINSFILHAIATSICKYKALFVMTITKTNPIAVHESVNWEIFSRYTMGDHDLQKDVVHLFRTHSREYISDLKFAADAAAWKFAAHKLKGTARSLGAVNLDKMATHAEAMDVVIHNRHHEDLTLDRVDIRVILRELEQELKRVNMRFAELF